MKWGAEFIEVSCKCAPPQPRARVHPLGWEESHFYWAEEESGDEFRGFRGYFIE